MPVDVAFYTSARSRRATSPHHLTAHWCPYAQRVWACLLEKGVPHQLHHVQLGRAIDQRPLDITEKPAWLLRLNPLGKVRCAADAIIFSSYSLSNSSELKSINTSPRRIASANPGGEPAIDGF